jgi:hypothetical protein
LVLEPAGRVKESDVPSGLPRTVKAIDTTDLIRLDAEAIACGFNRHHGAGWLAEHAAPQAVQYLRPAIVHRAGRRPKFSPHWRCFLLLTMRDGQEVFSLLDVWPASFDQLPDTLHPATTHALAHRLEYGQLLTSAQWADLNTRTHPNRQYGAGPPARGLPRDPAPRRAVIRQAGYSPASR